MVNRCSQELQPPYKKHLDPWQNLSDLLQLSVGQLIVDGEEDGHDSDPLEVPARLLKVELPIGVGMIDMVGHLDIRVLEVVMDQVDLAIKEPSLDAVLAPAPVPVDHG